MSVGLSSYLAAVLLLCAPSLLIGQTTLTVAAAADLSAAEPELASQFEKTNPIRLKFVTEASAVLAQQIENGAPYDVFLSANARFVDRLSSFRKIDPASVKTYAVGRLAIAWRDGKRHPVSDLRANWVRIVALPNPKLAPYGIAAQQALEHAGVWDVVRPKVVYGENVRQALQLFESGNADVVLTAASLFHGTGLGLIPADWHQPIIQKAGIVATSRNAEAARKFIAFLLSPAGQAVFVSFGLGPPEAKP